MPIPYVVRLWQDSNFGGTRRNLIQTESNLNRQLFNDRASSVEICDGPDPLRGNGWVKIYRHADFQGRNLPLEICYGYKNLGGVLGFNDITSSVQLDPTINGADQLIAGGLRKVSARAFDRIPLVLQVFNANNCPGDGPYAFVVENISKMTDYFGSEFDNTIQSIYCYSNVQRSGAPEWKAIVYEHNNFTGQSKEILPYGPENGVYNTLGTMRNKISSIKIVPA